MSALSLLAFVEPLPAQEPPVRATYVQPIRSAAFPTPVRFVVHNDARSAARAFSFRWLEPAEAGSFGVPALAVLPPGADYVVEGRINVPTLTAGDTALLHVEYSLGAARRSLIVKLPVVRATHGVADAVTATMTAGEGPLVDYETRRFYLTLTHSGAAPVTVGVIGTRLPPFVSATGTTRFAPGGEKVKGNRVSLLSPGQTLVVAFDLKLNGPVNPGRHVLLFDVPLKWERGGTPTRANKVVSATVPVAVLGESEALQFLAIPSFLFMPGFIILVTVGLLWKWDLFAPVRPNFSFPFAAREAEFWVVSVTASIALWLVLARVTGRNYLERHSASDVAKIWIVALASGVILFALIGAANRAFLSWARSPMRVLAMIQRRDPGALLAQRRVRFSVDDREGLAFVIEPERRDAQSVHLAPPILLTWNEREGMGDLARRALEDVLASRTATIAQLLAVLRPAVRENVVTLRWNSTPLLWGPTRVVKHDVQDWDAGRELLIEEEPALQTAGRYKG